MEKEQINAPEPKEKIDYTDSLPCKFVDEEKKNNIIKQAEETEIPLNDALKFINESGVSYKTVEEVRNITVEKVRKFIDDECRKFLKSSSFIPKEVQMDTRMKYYNAFKEIEPYVSEVENILARYGNVKLILGEDNLFHFDKTELAQLAEEQATVRTDKEQREAYRVYKKLYHAIKECNQWEKDHQWYEFSTNGYNAYSEGKFQNFSAWAVMAHAIFGAEPTEMTPERFLKMCGVCCGRSRNV